MIEIIAAGENWALSHGGGLGSSSRAGAHGWGRSPHDSSLLHPKWGIPSPPAPPRPGHRRLLCTMSWIPGIPVAKADTGLPNSFGESQPSRRPGQECSHSSLARPSRPAPAPHLQPSRAGFTRGSAQNGATAPAPAGDSAGTRAMEMAMGEMEGSGEHQRARPPLRPCSTPWHGATPLLTQGPWSTTSAAARVPKEGGVHAQGPVLPAATRVIRAEQEPRGRRSWSGALGSGLRLASAGARHCRTSSPCSQQGPCSLISESSSSNLALWESRDKPG